MKKSNALMLSYIIFLVIAFLVDCFFAWDGLGKVAMAATLAGLFFAIADLIGWRVASEQDFCKAVQKALKAVIASVDKLKLCFITICIFAGIGYIAAVCAGSIGSCACIPLMAGGIDNCSVDVTAA